MGIKDWAEKKENERREREWADSDYRMKQFRYFKNQILTSYENSVKLYELNKEKYEKPEFTKIYAQYACFVPDVYGDDFIEYCGDDSKFVLFMKQESNDSDKDDEEYDDDDEEYEDDDSESESSDTSDIKAKLKKLKALKDEGLISDKDYEKKKAALLDSL